MLKGELGRIAMNCPNKKDKVVEDKKKFYKKKKDGQAYLIEWDSDVRSDDDDDDGSYDNLVKMFVLTPTSPSRRPLHSSHLHFVLWQRVMIR
jgi:hypothetical protein